MHRGKLSSAGAVVVTVLAASLLAACGGSEPQGSGTEDGSNAARVADRAFVQDMTPHHESAVAMAEVARERADHSEIKTLADNIATSQQAEIVEMADLGEAIGAKPGGPSSMDMPENEMQKLTSASPFDRTFIDMMIPHHQAAIKMARTTLEKGKDPGVRDLAERVIAAQSKEIEDMNKWRAAWYGKPSPAGGVPAAASGGDDAQGY